MAITILPAIDLRGGKCVRLKQGDFSKETIYNGDPAAQALIFAQAGARWLHVVDLDGAKSGAFENKAAVSDILAAVSSRGVKVQTGGGVRSLDGIEQRLLFGCSRVIIGSKAVSDIEFVGEAVRKFGDKIAVGVDAKNGMAAGAGWESVSDVRAETLIAALVSVGVKRIIYTDISRDGMMKGLNIGATQRVADLAGGVIASGGVAGRDDIKRAEAAGCEGVIVGSALYNGALDLKEIITEFEG